MATRDLRNAASAVQAVFRPRSRQSELHLHRDGAGGNKPGDDGLAQHVLSLVAHSPNFRVARCANHHQPTPPGSPKPSPSIA